MHESSFTIEKRDFQGDGYGHYLLIPNKSIKTFAEGEEFMSKINSIMLFRGNEVIVYLEIDGLVVSDNKTFICK